MTLKERFKPGTRVRWSAYPGQKWRSGTIREWTRFGRVIIDWDEAKLPDKRSRQWLEHMTKMDLLDELATI